MESWRKFLCTLKRGIWSFLASVGSPQGRDNMQMVMSARMWFGTGTIGSCQKWRICSDAKGSSQQKTYQRRDSLDSRSSCQKMAPWWSNLLSTWLGGRKWFIKMQSQSHTRKERVVLWWWLTSFAWILGGFNLQMGKNLHVLEELKVDCRLSMAPIDESVNQLLLMKIHCLKLWSLSHLVTSKLD